MDLKPRNTQRSVQVLSVGSLMRGSRAGQLEDSGERRGWVGPFRAMLQTPVRDASWTSTSCPLPREPHGHLFAPAWGWSAAMLVSWDPTR